MKTTYTAIPHMPVKFAPIIKGIGVFVKNFILGVVIVALFIGAFLLAYGAYKNTKAVAVGAYNKSPTLQHTLETPRKIITELSR